MFIVTEEKGMSSLLRQVQQYSPVLFCFSSLFCPEEDFFRIDWKDLFVFLIIGVDHVVHVIEVRDDEVHDRHHLVVSGLVCFSTVKIKIYASR